MLSIVSLLSATTVGYSEEYEEGISLDSASAVVEMEEEEKILLNSELKWQPEVLARLEEFILANGKNAPTFDPAKPPVAIFDWDNTIIKNDIGDLAFAWMLKNDKILQPESGDWRKICPHLSSEAVLSLASACGGTEAGKPIKTSTNTACADELLSIYSQGKTLNGKVAFKEINDNWLEPSYALAAFVFKGYKPDEVHGFAKLAIKEALDAPVGATQMIGSGEYNAYVRVYDEMKDLVRVLKEYGFDVWIVSASTQYVVETFAAQIGMSKDRVIGIRSEIGEDGKILSVLKPCGPSKPGESNLMTYRDGKRCWINKVIFENDGPHADKPAADLNLRPVFSAGDSDTDVSFMLDATGLKLVIDRGSKELMSYARSNIDGKWLVHPMFM